MRIVKEHDERRNEIITTAEEFFLTKGFNKTTVNDILKRIGIAKGTFYHYFVSKEEVLEAVIGQIIDQEILRAKEIQQSNDTALEKLITFLSQNNQEDTRKEEIVDKFQLPENALMKQRALEETINQVCPVLAEIIEVGRQQGEFRTEHPLESIQFLIAGIQTMFDNIEKLSPETIQSRVIAATDLIYKVLDINPNIHPYEQTVTQLQKIFLS